MKNRRSATQGLGLSGVKTRALCMVADRGFPPYFSFTVSAVNAPRQEGESRSQR